MAVAGPPILDSINARIAGCTSCALSKGRTNTVPGEGSPTAEVMFIGEAPGQTEDELGRPFVGRAGKLLDDLIVGLGMRRSDVFIGNMVKCRPPANRNPEAQEMEACSAFLDEQLEAIDPLVIVTLGAVPLTRFSPNSKISSVRGQVLEYQGRALLPTYHPAYALRNPSAVDSMRDDLKNLPSAILQGISLRRSVAAVSTLGTDTRASVEDHPVGGSTETDIPDDGSLGDNAPAEGSSGIDAPADDSSGQGALM